MEQTTTAVAEPDVVAELEAETAVVVADARAIEITDQDSLDFAALYLTDGIKPALKRIAATFDPIDTAQKAARKITIAERKKLEGPLLEAERIIKTSIGDYQLEQQRVAAAEEAERIRVAREEAEARQLEEAAALEEAGHEEAAIEKLAAPAVPVVVEKPAAPKAEGVSVRTKPDFRIIDASAIAPEYLKPDEVKIRKIVGAFGADAEKMVGGIEVFDKPIVTARAS